MQFIACVQVYLILAHILSRNASSESGQLRYPKTGEDTNVSYIVERFKRTWAVEQWKQLGYFKEEQILDINIHWLKFDAPNDISFYALGTTYMLFIVVGFTGNLLVIFLFARCKSLRTPANYLIVNLAITDGLMSLKSVVVVYNCFHKGPALGELACRLFGFLGGLTGTTSIITLSVISFDRYFVIKFPLKRSFSKARIKICLAIAWIYGIIFSIIPAMDVGFGKYTYEGYLTTCSFDYLTDSKKIKIFIIVFFVAAWVVPFILISFSYGNILKVVTSRTITSKRGRESFRHMRQEMNKRQEITVARVAFSTILLWFVSWTPYAIVALLGVFDQKYLITPLVSMFPALFCKTASCLDAYVYALSHPKFKMELRKLCFRQRDINRKVFALPGDTQRDFKNEKAPHKNPKLKHQDAEDEVEEINIDSICLPTSASGMEICEKVSETIVSCGDQKTGPSMFEMICMRPDFKNKSSGLRKLARQWSSKEKDKDNDEEDKEL
nr:unnamed protein product [Callosobruchus analis]